MTFTTTPPTTPGFYAWRIVGANDGPLSVGEVFAIENQRELVCEITGRNGVTRVCQLGGEWCRLVPAEEIEKAWYEAKKWPNFWHNSRAKRVMEGRE